MATPDPCCPSAPAARCQFCRRLVAKRPVILDGKHPAHDALVIDASALRPAERCPFYIGGPKHPAALFAPRQRVKFDATQIGAGA